MDDFRVVLVTVCYGFMFYTGIVVQKTLTGVFNDTHNENVTVSKCARRVNLRYLKRRVP